MGTSTNVSQFIRKLERYSNEIATNRGPLNATGMAGKKIFEAHAAQAGVLGSVVAGKRKAIGVRYDIKNQRSNLADGTLVVTYTGPAHLVNNPTAAHVILPKRRPGSRRRRGARALTIEGNLRARANHPGTPGKGFAQRAITECRAVLPGILARKLLTEPLKRIFG